MRKRKILVLTQFYRPEPNFITADVAEELARHTEVIVVTAHPNYPYGKFYPGTRYWMPSKTTENGVTVWRVPFFPDHSRSKLRRMLTYLSFALSAALLAPFVAGRPSLVWVYQGPFTSIVAALWFKLAYRSRVILTCADLWPESFVAAGVARPGLLIRLLTAYRRATNRIPDTIICSTRGILERFAEEGVPRRRLHFVPVWVEGAESPADAPAVEAAAEPTIVYAGNLGPAQQLATVLYAAGELEREGERVRFDFYGSGADEESLRALARELRLSKVRFHGRVPPEEAFRASSSAFAQLVSLRPDPLFRMTIPSKVFACFAAGAPILCGLEGEAAELMAQSGGAIPFDPSCPSSLAAAIRELLRRSPRERAAMRARLQAYYGENFQRRVLLDRYLDIVLGIRSGAAARAIAKL